MMNQMSPRFGTTVLAPDRTRFCLWAPAADQVQLLVPGHTALKMARDDNGWHVLEAPFAAGTRYKFQVTPDLAVPDPASRYQPDDVHGHSLVVEPGSYDWMFPEWAGRPWHETVIYELHVGALGGFAGVEAHLAQLAELGVTAIELMPIADFPGVHNWGYDGVLPYAPDHSYGTPDELKHLIDAAHGLGLMVFLDVVYNHFGPDGNYLAAYAPQLYRSDRTTPWGDAIDFRVGSVRQFFLQNALYWIEECRFDGLRLDAVHEIKDAEFLLALADRIRTAVPPGRHVHLMLENEDNDSRLLRKDRSLPGFDAQWADDFHHCIHVLLTGEHEGYYEDFAQRPATQLARCLREGFAFQGETSQHTGRARGTASGHLPPTAFIACLQNHDQIGNRALGERLHHLADRDALRAATVLLLLSPQIPLLFMGQEWAASAPFQFFAGHTGELGEAVRAGRRREFARFAAFADPKLRDRIPDPTDTATFTASCPDFAEIDEPEHRQWWDLHRQLLAIRAAEIAPRLRGAVAVSAEPLGAAGVQAAWRLGDGSLLTISVNLGRDPVPYEGTAGKTLFATTAVGGNAILAPRSAVAILTPATGTSA